MIKRLICKNVSVKATIAVLICAALSLSACSDGGVGTHGKTGPQGVGDVLQQQMEKEDSEGNETTNSEPDKIVNENSSDANTVSEPEYIIGDDGTLQEAGSENSTDGNTDSGSTDSAGAENVVTESSGNGEIDIDLTDMGADMVYAEVYNMMARPNDYIGKTIKMTGLYSYYYDENSGKEYHACIIEDALACCSQGIEFVPTDNYKYPDDFPENGGYVTVTGVFDIYLEADFAFMTLRNAIIEK
ncbi:MAG: hypothetical protein K5669_01015 [Lachnospiraceae bacterium]|nr:hypothetical protein [Lachnospiraceae bacterium]